MLSTAIINDIVTKEKVIAFTFDDGPNPIYTPQILDIFQQYDSKATFYMIGSQMEQHPELVKEVYKQGHEIGNHTYTHPQLSELNEHDCMHEIIQTENLILDTVGTKPQTFRPPYFDHNEKVEHLICGLGYTMIGAVNGETLDWEQPGIQHIIDKTRETVGPGSILLFHDGFGDRSQSIEAVRILVSELISEGYRLVTVSELLKLLS